MGQHHQRWPIGVDRVCADMVHCAWFHKYTVGPTYIHAGLHPRVETPMGSFVKITYTKT